MCGNIPLRRLRRSTVREKTAGNLDPVRRVVPAAMRAALSLSLRSLAAKPIPETVDMAFPSSALIELSRYGSSLLGWEQN